MFRSTYAKSRYRVVDRKKFALSSVLSTILILALLYTSVLGARAVYAAAFKPSDVVTKVHEEIVETPQKVVPAFQFTMGDMQISSTDKDDFINKLQATIIEQSKKVKDKNDKLYTVQTQYTYLVKQKQAVLDENQRIRGEYGYVLNYPSSDVTIDDIKMVESLCKEYGSIVSPHLWFSLVEFESGYQSTSKSSESSASGWGQVIRGTAKSIYEDDLHLGTYNHKTMSTNKAINARMSIYLLSSLIKQSGITQGLINYNGGELGIKYVNIVASKLKTNANLTLKQIAYNATVSRDTM
jgi:hypothetical protein